MFTRVEIGESERKRKGSSLCCCCTCRNLSFFTYLARFDSKWSLAFLTLSLHTQTVSLCSSWVIQCCLCLLYASFLHLSLVRSSSFIHEGFLLPLLDFLHFGMDHWRSPLKINQLSWTPVFFSQSVLHWILPIRLLKWLKSALMKTRDVILLFASFPALRILNSIISCSLQPRLLLTFTALTSSSCCKNQTYQSALSLLGP